MHVLHLIARPIEVLIGVFCVVTATLLYPGEDGKIQSMLEDLWIEVEELKSLTLSKHAAFMSRVARLEAKILDLLFGQRLFSEQSIAVSFSVSLVSASYVSYQIGKAYGELGAMTMSFGPTVVEPHTTIKQELYTNLDLVVFACLALAIGVVAVAMRKSKPLVRRSVLAGLIVLLISAACLDNAGAASLILVAPTAIFGFICDLLFIVATRLLLKQAGLMESTLSILGLVIADTFLALLLVSPYLLLKYPLGELSVWIGLAVAYSNLVDVLLAAAFFLLCLLLLLHMMCWPLLTRTLFRIQDIGTKGRRAILTTVGLALLAAGITGKVPELVRKLIEKFGG